MIWHRARLGFPSCLMAFFSWLLLRVRRGPTPVIGILSYDASWNSEITVESSQACDKRSETIERRHSSLWTSTLDLAISAALSCRALNNETRVSFLKGAKMLSCLDSLTKASRDSFTPSMVSLSFVNRSCVQISAGIKHSKDDLHSVSRVTTVIWSSSRRSQNLHRSLWVIAMTWVLQSPPLGVPNVSLMTTKHEKHEIPDIAISSQKGFRLSGRTSSSLESTNAMPSFRSMVSSGELAKPLTKSSSEIYLKNNNCPSFKATV